MCQPSVAHIADVIADVLSPVCTDPDFDVSSLHNVTSTPLDKLHTCTSHAAVRQLTRSGIFSTMLSCYTIANSQTTFLGRLHLVLLVRCKGGDSDHTNTLASWTREVTHVITYVTCCILLTTWFRTMIKLFSP